MSNRSSSDSGTPDLILNEAVGTFTQVILIGHAQEQMAIRGITQEDVLRTLREPDENIPEDNPLRTRVRRHRTLRFAIDVVYEQHPPVLVVITTIKIESRITRGLRRRRRS